MSRSGFARERNPIDHFEGRRSIWQRRFTDQSGKQSRSDLATSAEKDPEQSAGIGLNGSHPDSRAGIESHRSQVFGADHVKRWHLVIWRVCAAGDVLILSAEVVHDTYVVAFEACGADLVGSTLLRPCSE